MRDGSDYRGWKIVCKSHNHNYRENTVFAGKHEPTASQTMATMAMEQRALGIHIQHCERGSLNCLVNSTPMGQVAQNLSTTTAAAQELTQTPLALVPSDSKNVNLALGLVRHDRLVCTVNLQVLSACCMRSCTELFLPW